MLVSVVAAGVYPFFSGMKCLGVFLLLPEWDASSPQVHWYPFIHLWEPLSQSKMSTNTKSQHCVPGLEPRQLSPEESTPTARPPHISGGAHPVIVQYIPLTNRVWGPYVWVIDQVWSQDGWILAKFFFACLWTETESRSINSQKKNEANIQPSWPNELGQ